MSELFNLGDLVNPAGDPNAVAYIDLRDPDHPREYTHGDVNTQAKAVARNLTKRSFPKGASIGILSWNRADAKIALVFVDESHREQVRDSIPVINFDSTGSDGFAANLDFGEFETHRPETDEIAEILYTSGSTGRPKGVPLSHNGQLWMMQLNGTQFRSDQVRNIVAQPLFHMAGLFAPKRAILGHSLLVILPGFHARQYIETAAKYKITSIGGVPTLLARIIKEVDLLDGLDMSSIKQIGLGSAPLTLSLLEKISAAFPQAAINHGYGSTESKRRRCCFDCRWRSC